MQITVDVGGCIYLPASRRFRVRVRFLLPAQWRLRYVGPSAGALVPQYRSIMPLCNQPVVNPPAFSRTTSDLGGRS